MDNYHSKSNSNVSRFSSSKCNVGKENMVRKKLEIHKHAIAHGADPHSFSPGNSPTHKPPKEGLKANPLYVRIHASAH